MFNGLWSRKNSQLVILAASASYPERSLLPAIGFLFLDAPVPLLASFSYSTTSLLRSSYLPPPSLLPHLPPNSHLSRPFLTHSLPLPIFHPSIPSPPLSHPFVI